MKILATILIIATIYISGSYQCGIPGIVCEGRHHDAVEPVAYDYPQQPMGNTRRFTPDYKPRPLPVYDTFDGVPIY